MIFLQKFFFLIQHPKYDKENKLNDVAIIKLTDEIEFNNFIQPACLPIDDNYPSNEIDAWAAGWGKLKFNGKTPETLQNVKLKIYHHSKCNLGYSNTKVDWKKQICAGILML